MKQGEQKRKTRPVTTKDSLYYQILSCSWNHTFLYSKWKIWKRLPNAFENRGCTCCFCFLSAYIVIWHLFESGFLLVSRGLITATCDDLLSVLILDFSVGSGFPDHLCLLQTHLPSLSDTFFLFFAFSSVRFSLPYEPGFRGQLSSVYWSHSVPLHQNLCSFPGFTLLFEKRAFLPI